MVNIQHVIFLTLLGCLLIPSPSAEAQRLKLPNFLPFKKKTQEIKPIRLSDKAAPRIQNKPHLKRGVFDFLKPDARLQPKSPEAFSQKSKSFLSKTGDGIGKFASGTKTLLSEAWHPPKAKKAWWNQGSDSAGDLKQSLLAWPGQQHKTIAPPPVPRTAQHYKDGEPRYRFE